jgi:hypothetical protein
MNFSLEKLFAKDAPPVSEFFAKGMAATFNVCSWGGFKYFFRDMFRALKDGKDEGKVAMANAILPLIPFFFLKANGKFAVDLDENMVKDFIGVDKTKMAFQNAF